MNVMKRLRPIAVAAGVMLAVVACGGNGGSSGTSNKGTIVIGADVPLNGTDASQGQPIANGAELAIQKQGSIDGFKLQFKDYDDAVNGTHDPSKGAQNVQAMAGDAQILGMIGPLNSNVGQAEIPIGAQNTLPMISPATTNQCLTRDDLNCNGAASALRKGNPNPFFRIVTIDTNQGPAMADYAYNQLKLRKVAVGDDNETYGLGIANAFAGEFKKLGGQVVQQQNFDWQSTQDYTPFLQKAKNAGAQGIYWGGVTATNSCVPRQEMASVGFTDTTPYMGGDGIIQDSNCVKAAGAMAPGTYATIAAINPQQVPTAKSAISAYNKQFGS
ncbi:MAG: branched-chain amino acid ABC transporter substrate-binding protein, partial [Candidatus Dormiibacterota bacterium]